MQKRQVYLDHGATSPLREEALEAMLPYLQDKYGNPSSMHSSGRDARHAVERAREQTALALGAEPDEIFFTSGGTEANNIAIKGTAKRTARARKKKGHLVTSSVEHHAVLNVCKELADEGFQVTFLPVDRYGLVSVESVKRALTPETFLISIMTANNEVGTIEPVAEIGALARERGILFHTDAVQAVGQLPIDLRDLKVDLLSLSAHKFNGPKGVGALYVRRGTPVEPLYGGGGQERGLRPGTENVAGIIGLARALGLAVEELPEKTRWLQALRDRLIEGLLGMGDVVLNGHPSSRLPGNVNVSFNYIEGEALLLGLDLEGIAASSGSACTSGSPEPSHVLLAMGLDHQIARGSLRLTLGRGNSDADVDYLFTVLSPLVKRLRKMSALYPGQG
ncbi:MAG: cysteine desulfurase NifS [Dethiobacteria bacterium]|nr:cysteine desulfurase NifS [Bacillota bacterium]HPZ41864.1 cysteine desulfurase NifS [Bacillota bacterium]HQD52696.1 cysteine desulfurase NifS [Bacillota bacterium]